jgi:hypothetical protein
MTALLFARMVSMDDRVKPGGDEGGVLRWTMSSAV